MRVVGGTMSMVELKSFVHEALLDPKHSADVFDREA
jgi:hypothetical protein